MTILIDASVFCAYANSRDIHHIDAKNIIQDTVSEKYGISLTTDYIFDETVTVIARKSDRKNAVEVGKFLLNSEIFLAKIDSLIFQKAWEIFQKANELSFTDCSSIAFMQIFGMKNIATFDKAFENIKNIKVINK